jgi:ketosteroid isomerase-like protein
MTKEQANTARFREAFRAWEDTRGDPNVWLPRITDDVVMRSIGGGRETMGFSKPRRGRAEFTEYLADLVGLLEMVEWRIDETVAEGDRVIGLGWTRWKHRLTGREIASRVVMVATYRDGRVCAFDEYYDTLAVAEAAAA